MAHNRSRHVERQPALDRIGKFIAVTGQSMDDLDGHAPSDTLAHKNEPQLRKLGNLSDPTHRLIAIQQQAGMGGRRVERLQQQLGGTRTQPLIARKGLGFDHITFRLWRNRNVGNGVGCISSRSDTVQQNLYRLGPDLRFIGKPTGQVGGDRRFGDILVLHLVSSEFQQCDPLEILSSLGSEIHTNELDIT